MAGKKISKEKRLSGQKSAKARSEARAMEASNIKNEQLDNEIQDLLCRPGVARLLGFMIRYKKRKSRPLMPGGPAGRLLARDLIQRHGKAWRDFIPADDTDASAYLRKWFVSRNMVPIGRSVDLIVDDILRFRQAVIERRGQAFWDDFVNLGEVPERYLLKHATKQKPADKHVAFAASDDGWSHKGDRGTPPPSPAPKKGSLRVKKQVSPTKPREAPPRVIVPVRQILSQRTPNEILSIDTMYRAMHREPQQDPLEAAMEKAVDDFLQEYPEAFDLTQVSISQRPSMLAALVEGIRTANGTLLAEEKAEVKAARDRVEAYDLARRQAKAARKAARATARKAREVAESRASKSTRSAPKSGAVSKAQQAEPTTPIRQTRSGVPSTPAAPKKAAPNEAAPKKASPAKPARVAAPTTPAAQRKSSRISARVVRRV